VAVNEGGPMDKKKPQDKKKPDSPKVKTQVKAGPNFLN
jgi:hypothetical protein